MTFHVFLSIAKRARTVPTGKNWLKEVEKNSKVIIKLIRYNLLVPGRIRD
jgi:hypothetical protein